MFIAFIIIVILLGGFVLLLRQAGRAGHPLLQSLRSRGIRPGTAELLLCSRPSFVSAGRLMTEREQCFLRRLDRVTDTRCWRLCPQVRVADIVRVAPDRKPQPGMVAVISSGITVALRCGYHGPRRSHHCSG